MAAWRMVSYKVIGEYVLGAKRGGGQITQPPTAANTLPPTVIVALTGPSETSSHHPGFCQKSAKPLPAGELLAPKPPTTIFLPSGSVDASPSGTSMAGTEEV